MAGIGEASAILGVAQLGLQLAQTLVTVIGDYRDAAININRLRDEVHLTSICLQQLGDLAKQNSLLPGRGVLETTNLRERCRAVIWEIRTVIKKGDDPLHPDEISKEEIDVSYFTAWKWALWTKKHLDGPRAELDRLKDSLTLTFVTHMAILGSRQEQDRYKQQIPGIKRNVDWAEEQYRGLGREEPEEPAIPEDILNAGPAEWQQFIKWKTDQTLNEDSVDEPPRGDFINAATTDRQPEKPQAQERPSVETTKFEFWTIHPMAGVARLPMKPGVAFTQNRNQLLRTWSKLDPWYATQVDALVQKLNSDLTHEWVVTGLKKLHRPFLLALKRPPSLQVYLRGDARKFTLASMQNRRVRIPIEVETRTTEVVNETAAPYTETIPIDMAQSEEEEDGQKLSDEDIIEKQLALYQQG